MKEHYNSIAATFDKNWGFTPKYMNWMISKIVSLLELSTENIFVDIGAGTGLYTKAIQNKIKFKNKVIFVEPSFDMANIVRNNSNFLVFNETSEIFFNREISFDKILFKEVIHHIKDRKELWEKLYKNLNKEGAFLIITRPQNTKLPLFDKAKDKFRENQPNYMDLINEVKKDNFEIKTYKDDFVFQLDKEKWYQMIKDRFMSDLSEFSNEEIDEGIAELEKKLIGNTLEIIDEIIFIYGKKI